MTNAPAPEIGSQIEPGSHYCHACRAERIAIRVGTIGLMCETCRSGRIRSMYYPKPATWKPGER